MKFSIFAAETNLCIMHRKIFVMLVVVFAYVKSRFSHDLAVKKTHECYINIRNEPLHEKTNSLGF